ncbi:anthranilate synthase component I [Nocardia tengchongensis]|uniref:anthranilate synthase component I n=1 Tax=Nocardia tengchongensis TaxID=2055889 RepID=UPI0036C6B9BC
MLHPIPMLPSGVHRWTTTGGVTVTRRVTTVDSDRILERLGARLDSRAGMLITSGVTYPGRYSRGAIGYEAPPLQLTVRGNVIELKALNQRGRVLLDAVAGPVEEVLRDVTREPDQLSGLLFVDDQRHSEEERTRRPNVTTVLRAICATMAGGDDQLLGLYGAFGYDLIFHMVSARRRHERDPRCRDLVLHLPDQFVVVDDRNATQIKYDFVYGGHDTDALPRVTPVERYGGGRTPDRDRDLPVGGYADIVRGATAAFRDGDLFEVVPAQSFYRRCDDLPSQVFGRLWASNPAPYGVFANLGEQEYLVGASPEMFVRVSKEPGRADARRVESCPISGTAPRGRDALADAENTRALLNSHKEESELTMCTDVDRNDKARVCVPGTVEVIGRRQIETYATLIHTVDHVVGRLRDEFDALDAFLSHAWAVTVTGAPKTAAVDFIEEHERGARRWYGGAFGMIGFDGTLDTALTLRTIHIDEGVAGVRAGATLLHLSVPAEEERETELKARAQLAALRADDVPVPRPIAAVATADRDRPRVVLVDHNDSFVQTLADYFRAAGAVVDTYRSEVAGEVIAEQRPDLVVLSPGPGLPADFGMPATLECARQLRIPVFGVCLGLQGIVEFYGGSLIRLPEPAHGEAAVVRVHEPNRLFRGVTPDFVAGRYHSWAATDIPDALAVTATTGKIVMAVEHRSEPVAGVQFHPESIMTAADGVGPAIVANALAMLVRRDPLPARQGRM